MTSLARRARTGRRAAPLVAAAHLVSHQYVATVLGACGGLLAARILGAAEYGRAAIAVAFPALVWSVCTAKTSTVTTRYLAMWRDEPERRDDWLALARLGYLIDGTLATLAFAVTALAVPFVTTDPSIRRLSVLWAASLPLASLQGTSLGILTAHEAFRAVARCQLLERATALLLLVALIAAGRGCDAIVVSGAAAQAIVGIVGFHRAWVAAGRPTAAAWRGAPLAMLPRLRHELLAALGWNYVAATVGGAVANVPVLILGVHRGTAEAGYLRLATSIVNVCGYVEAALSRVLYPRLARQHVAGTLAAPMRPMLACGLPVAGVLGCGALALPWVLPMLLGADFAKMVGGAQVMVVAAAASAVLFWVQPMLFARGHFGAWAKAQSAGALAVAVLAGPATLLGGFPAVAALVAAGRLLPITALATVASAGGDSRS